MDAYTDFAQVYDELMDDTPYEEWCAFLIDLFRKYGIDDISGENGRESQSGAQFCS